MAGTAEFVSLTRVENLKIYNWLLSSVDAGNSEKYAIDIPRKGSIRGIKVVAGDSSDMNILISQTKDDFSKTANLVISIDGITTGLYNELFNPPIPYFNNDTQMASKLHVKLENEDAVNDSGEVTLVLIVEHEAYLHPSLEK